MYSIIRERAQAVGEKIREVRISHGSTLSPLLTHARQENGVSTAIRSLYTYLHRAGLRPRTEKRGSVDLTPIPKEVDPNEIPVTHDILSVMGGAQNHRASTL
jgi:hypothetical protein